MLPQNLANRTLKHSDRILVVDDDDAIRLFVHTVLTSAGFDVVQCESGADAIQLIEKSEAPFQLVISDVVMPQLGGRQLASRLAVERPSAKILLMSGYPSLSSFLHNVASHSESKHIQYHFIAKPFTPKALLHEVRQILSEDSAATPA